MVKVAAAVADGILATDDRKVRSKNYCVCDK